MLVFVDRIRETLSEIERDLALANEEWASWS
jgi:hypothetical protein